MTWDTERQMFPGQRFWRCNSVPSGEYFDFSEMTVHSSVAFGVPQCLFSWSFPCNFPLPSRRSPFSEDDPQMIFVSLWKKFVNDDLQSKEENHLQYPISINIHHPILPNLYGYDINIYQLSICPYPISINWMMELIGYWLDVGYCILFFLATSNLHSFGCGLSCTNLTVPGRTRYHVRAALTRLAQSNETTTLSASGDAGTLANLIQFATGNQWNSRNEMDVLMGKHLLYIHTYIIIYNHSISIYIYIHIYTHKWVYIHT